MYTCIIIDDEQHCIDWMENLIKQNNILQIQESFLDPEKAMIYLAGNKVDVVFTDIQMPEISGIDILKSYHGKMEFIVSSAYPQYAIEGFNYDVLDYLLKPVSLLRFTKTIKKITEVLLKKRESIYNIETSGYFFVKTEMKGKQVKINFEDITLIEGRLNYIAIYTGKSHILSLQNLKNIIEILPKGKFIRVHASYIIPIKSIKQIEGSHLKLIDVDFTIPIGVTYKDKVVTDLGIVRK
jgi:DNA-binding LytR/AlgR family response regulator